VSTRARIIVLGYVVRGPLGGMAWHHLHYVVGLAQLGYDVYFIEHADNYPSCYDPVNDVMGTDPTYGLAFAKNAFDDLGLADRWCYYDNQSNQWVGPCASQIGEISKTADVVLNMSGINPLQPWFSEIPVRALIDTDPVFTQANHLANPEARALALEHNVFLSFAENILSPTCTVPKDGFNWIPTRQPIALDWWPVTPAPKDGKFTTVMLWNSYGAVEVAGQRYGLKSDSFDPYYSLPEKTGEAFELAVGGGKCPRAKLTELGWQLCDPRVPTHDPWSYRQYIQNSKGEFGVAKHGYAISHSGWFSERTAAYLASGRPVVVQDTGFTEWLPTGSGVFAFNTLEQAIAGVREVNERYEQHCKGAREIAEQYFDARKVLPELIERATTYCHKQETGDAKLSSRRRHG
jgi:hypothetical protein